MPVYPRWAFYSARDKPPPWVADFVRMVGMARETIDSTEVTGLTSDAVLAHLRPGLETLGFRVEAGKKAADRITLPVLYGEQGKPRVKYDVDGVHEELGI